MDVGMTDSESIFQKSEPGFPTAFIGIPSVQLQRLNATQNACIELLEPILKKYPEIRLSGGTALSRCWLNHRVSFDLDFFLPPDLELGELRKELKLIRYTVNSIHDTSEIYSQLFGSMKIKDVSIEISFMQDRFFKESHVELNSSFGSLIPIENVDTIYNRKINIIAGLSENIPYFSGRNKIRDIFDLAILSQAVRPILEQIGDDGILKENFLEGLASIDMLSMLDDAPIFAATKWEHFVNPENAINHLYEETGMTIQSIEEAYEDDSNSPQP